MIIHLRFVCIQVGENERKSGRLLQILKNFKQAKKNCDMNVKNKRKRCLFEREKENEK